MKSALYKSLALHVIVLLLFLTDLSVFWRRNMVLNQVPIIIDLEQVKISEMTNLPEKAKFADKTSRPLKKAQPKPEIKPAQKPDPKPEIKSEVVEKKAEVKTSEPKEEITPPKKDFMVPPQPRRPKIKKKEEPKKVQPKPKPAPKAKPKPQPKPKTAEVKKAPKKEVKQQPQVSALKNLMDSVNSIEKKVTAEERQATLEKGIKAANMGIEGGNGGSYFNELTISDTDAIAARLRQCWNLDPGARGVEDMLIEIKAYLNKDGTVSDVKIADMGRYRSDGHFRAVANSARVAVYKCAPFSILSQKYATKYDVWKVMKLRFNPLNHSVY